MTENAKPRLILPALLLSVFALGGGYLYLGRPRRALAWALLALAGFVLLLGPGGGLTTPIGGLVMLAALPAMLWMIVDTIRIARAEAGYVLKLYNRRFIYSAAVVAQAALGTSYDRAGAHKRTFIVSSASNEPGLIVGDRIFADMRAFSSLPPSRGDFVVYRGPRDLNAFGIRRVIGLPGERVRLIGGVVQINGQPVRTEDGGTATVQRAGQPARNVRMWRETLPGGPTITTYAMGPTPGDDTAEVTVPADHFFVLGDNRDSALDSRDPPEKNGVGLVPRANIAGRVAWIYWSSDRSRVGRQF